MLITGRSPHRLRQHGSYANSKSSGNISNWKKHLLFHPVSLWEARAPKYPLTLWLRWGHFTPFFTCKEMEMYLHWSLEWMPALHCTAAIWWPNSHWHLLLPGSFGLQLEHHSVCIAVIRPHRKIDVCFKLVIFMSDIVTILLQQIYCQWYKVLCLFASSQYITWLLNTITFYFVCLEIAKLTQWPTQWSEWEDNTCLQAKHNWGSISC